MARTVLWGAMGRRMAVASVVRRKHPEWFGDLQTLKRAADRDRTGIISLEDRSVQFADQVLERKLLMKGVLAPP